MALVTSNEFSVSIVPSVPTSVYTYNVAQDSKSFEWRYQSMGPLSDGVSFILRGTGDHDTWGDNSIRVFNAQSLVTTTLYDHNVAGNRAPFTQYDNWMTPLLPAAFTGDTDWLVWWTIGTFRMSSLAPPAGAWTHVKVKLRSGDDLARPIAALSSANPAVATILNDGADDFIATNLSGGPVKAYLYGPGCSLHDTVVQTSNVVSDATTITLAVNGSAVTGFVANQLWASPVSNGTLSATDVFSSGGRHSDLYVDKTSGQRFLGAGTGAAPYNGVQIYWPGGNKYVMFGGGAGSTSPISTNYSWFVQPNTTAPPAWEIEDFALQNVSGSGFVPRSNFRNSCAIVGNWLYLAGGVVGEGQTNWRWLFHRIRLTDGWVQRLQDLPANTSPYLGAMSYDTLRHRIVYSSDRCLVFDVDSLNETNLNLLGDPWVDLFGTDIWDYYDNPSGAYHPMNGHDLHYVASLDKHFIKAGRESYSSANGATYVNYLGNTRATRADTFWRPYWSTLQLPTTWIV